MQMPFIVASVSGASLLLLLFLFYYEKQSGKRVGRFVRRKLDFLVLRIEHFFHSISTSTNRDMLRQVMHYFLHTFLLGLIKSLKSIEGRLRLLIRSNKSMAKRSRKERRVRNKLETVALHKMEVALSDDEKKRRKRESLEED